MENNKMVERDFFTDRSILVDPYAYIDEMRDRGPVFWSDRHDVLMVTGFDEAMEILRNHKDFSSVIAPAGPTAPLPFTVQGNDISEAIESHRHKFVGGEQVVSFDGERHAASRSLLNRLFTPSRLKANEDYMNDLAQQMVASAVAAGHCEIIGDVATPYVTLVIADLLGVPEQDRPRLQDILTTRPTAGSVDNADAGVSLEFLLGKTAAMFAEYFDERRKHPREDVLTELAMAKFPDGSTPNPEEIVTDAIFLFVAGQGTSAKLIGNAVKYLAENLELQQQLRNAPSLINAFIEEMLRFEGSVKATFRLARRDARVGQLDVPAGTKVAILFGGANRDPQRWDSPESFQLDRERVREHLAFGRGTHTCIGAPLARAEARVMIDCLLKHTSDIAISAAHHGANANRSLEYEPSYIIRGLTNLYVDLIPR